MKTITSKQALNSHGKVWKVFDSAQKAVSLDRVNRELVLTYLITNLTCWTTHSTAFTQLYDVQDALKQAVMQNHSAIIQAQVGAAKSSEARHLIDDADVHIKIIQDHTFWARLEQVIGDIELICYGTISIKLMFAALTQFYGHWWEYICIFLITWKLKSLQKWHSALRSGGIQHISHCFFYAKYLILLKAFLSLETKQILVVWSVMEVSLKQYFFLSVWSNDRFQRSIERLLVDQLTWTFKHKDERWKRQWEKHFWSTFCSQETLPISKRISPIGRRPLYMMRFSLFRAQCWRML